uniref:Photolyase/cryptochrome alpha/beta domain-containing protein n=1 Tax=Anopheles atroparvus TaxID=41427 RepID=A0A182ISA3_ANOAO
MTKKTSTIGHYKSSSSGVLGVAGMNGFTASSGSGIGTPEKQRSSSGQSHHNGVGGMEPSQDQSHHHRSHHHNDQQQQQHRQLHLQQHATSKRREKHTVHWFRKGLRLHDNPALKEGLRGATTFRCVFIIDPWFVGSSNVGINKWRFLLQCLDDLDRNLRKLNSRLFVIRGQPADALPKLFKEWGTTCLTFEEDPEPFGRVRDHNISEKCKELGIAVISAASHTLFNLERIIEGNGGRPPLTYHQFQAIIASMDAPPSPEAAITLDAIGNATTPQYDDDDDKYGVPTLEELGFETDALRPPVWVGGETEALARLERHLERKAWVASFGRPKMTPQSLLASQTGLSPYLRFGCLSTRLFYSQLTDLYKKIKKASPPLSLHGQLLWREFFYCAATKNPNFDKMVGNPICVQIPWDRNAEALAKWGNGQTGFPWIDAIMTQLREEGWIHHLARHAVACFLTRGDLWISWEEGMKVFEELLLDADWSVNAGMWMWLSCSSFFQQFFHCYCPVKFGRKADPNGDYIRRYLPVLKNFPTRYIHEPWNATEGEQRAAKCLIGKDYPLPMVNHAIASRANMERIKQVYQHLAKYRTPSETTEGAECAEKGGSAIAGAMTAAKVHHMNASSMNDSPSPTTIMTSVNSSGNYMCRSNPPEQSGPNAKVITYHPSHVSGNVGARMIPGGNTGEDETGGGSVSTGGKRVSDEMGNHNYLTQPMHAPALQQRLQHRQQHRQQSLQQSHQQRQQSQENTRPSSNSEHRFGEPPVAEYAAIKPDSLSTLMRGGSDRRFSNLQDQLSNSLMSLECDVMSTKLKPNNYEYERNQNIYNGQFKVEYSDNFNSGYGLRNAVFYGGKREGENDDEQNADDGNHNDAAGDGTGGNRDEDRGEGSQCVGSQLLALAAMSTRQDSTGQRAFGAQVKQEPPVQTHADKPYHRRQEAHQSQQKQQRQDTPVKKEQTAPHQPSHTMQTDCDYEPERHNLLSDVQRPQRKSMQVAQTERTQMEQGLDQAMQESPAGADNDAVAK